MRRVLSWISIGLVFTGAGIAWLGLTLDAFARGIK